MGCGLTCNPSRDIDEIYEVLGHPDIWPLLSVREPDKNLIPLRLQDIYLIIKTDQTIGCVYFKVVSGYELEMHPYVLPEHRKGNSVRAVQCAMDWAASQQIKRIIVHIPDEYPHVLAFARRLGFEHASKNTLTKRL